MKISKELKTGVITVLAIGLLVAGINFLKGNSFFGGDKTYFAYLPSSGQVSSATPVTINGVTVGRVQSVEFIPENELERSVRISFSIQQENLKLTKGTRIEAGSLDFFNKGIMLHLGKDHSKGYYSPGDTLEGYVEVAMMAQIKDYADPITQKLQIALGSIDKMVNDVKAFWDTTATSSLEESLGEIKVAIHSFGNAAKEIESLVVDEKVKLSKILNNVESITLNLKKSNEKIEGIIGNVEKLSDDLVTSDFKAVIENAKNTLAGINVILDQAKTGEGTLGKLLGDETLYNELVKTNLELQELVNDIQVHPERYIHFSVLGAKTKGVPLTKTEERKLKQILDTIP